MSTHLWLPISRVTQCRRKASETMADRLTLKAEEVTCSTCIHRIAALVEGTLALPPPIACPVCDGRRVVSVFNDADLRVTSCWKCYGRGTVPGC